MCQKDISQSWQVELGFASTTIHLAQMISIKQPAVFGEIRAMCTKQVKFFGPAWILHFLAYWSQDKCETLVMDQQVCQQIGPAMSKSKCDSEAYLIWSMQFHVSIAAMCVWDDFKVWWFVTIMISYEMFEGSVCFFPGSFGANEASRRTRVASVTWYVLKGVIFWSNLSDFIQG